MPLTKLSFRPGINRENTNYANEGGWYDMDKVRFRYGTPEKIGGWKAAVSGSYKGVARQIISWATLAGDVLLGIGTNYRYYLNYGSQYYNITPIRTTATLNNPFAVTLNSSVVKVVAANHGAQQGDIVIYTGAGIVAGIDAATFNDPEGHRVISVIDANTYTIDVGTLATTTVQGGGTVSASYEITSGLTVHSIGGGFGSGTWNAPFTTAATNISGTGRLALNDTDTTINVDTTTGFSTTGAVVIDSEIISYTGTTSTSFTGCTRGTNGSMAAVHNRRQLSDTTWAPVPVKQVVGYSSTMGWGLSTIITSVTKQIRLWSSSAYGQDMLMCPRGDTIYYWTKDLTTYARAVALRDPNDATRKFVPHTVNYMMVSDIYRFILALGANSYNPNDPLTAFDPMLVRWSAQDDVTNWVPSALNQSGEIRLSAGSYLITGMNMKQELLVWSDTALYSFQYAGPPYVWRSSLSMNNLSIMGPNAVAAVNNNAFWMGSDKFYVYTGRVDTLPCSIQQYIFDDIAQSQNFQTFAGTNEGFNEIWWFYVSNAEVQNATYEGRDPTIDKYVIYNHAEQCWYYGSMNRTAWIDSALYAGPLACTGDSTSGVVVMHEQGNDDNTTGTPEPINAYIQSSDIDIGDGHNYLFVTRILPDLSFNGSTSANPKVTLNLYPRENSGSAYNTLRTTGGAVQSAQIYSSVTKTYTVQLFTQQVDTRVRGRAIAFRIESDDLGVQWKMGAPRIDARPDGRKS